MVLDHMFQDHNLGAKSHRSKCRNPSLAKSRENLRSGIFGIAFGERLVDHSRDSDGALTLYRSQRIAAVP